MTPRLAVARRAPKKARSSGAGLGFAGGCSHETKREAYGRHGKQQIEEEDGPPAPTVSISQPPRMCPAAPVTALMAAQIQIALHRKAAEKARPRIAKLLGIQEGCAHTT